MRRVAVGDVMTRNFVSVNAKTDLYRCAQEMVRQRVDSLVITEGERLIGILTSRDILWALVKKPGINLRSVKSVDIAARKVAVIKPSADIRQALHKMKHYGFRRLPVISKGHLVGLITLKDILRIDPTLYNQLGELADIREETQKLRKADDEWDLDGLCYECGGFSPLLKVENRLLCPDCREELY
jgi:CBS domain-containing protein